MNPAIKSTALSSFQTVHWYWVRSCPRTTSVIFYHTKAWTSLSWWRSVACQFSSWTWQSYAALHSSKAFGGLFYHEQSYLSIAGCLHGTFQPSSESVLFLSWNISWPTQLTSLSALQSSLDILRKHRPDYTPRTGFVWPITDPSIEDPTKKRTAEGEFNLTESETTSKVSHDNRKEAPKRQQNNWLLMNAMRTTAAHSKMSFSSSSFVQATDNLTVDTSATTTMRSSPTPGPTSQEPLPKVSSNISQEPTKGPAGGGKKKRKRSSLNKIISIYYKYLICISGTSLAPPPPITSTWLLQI